MQMTTLCEEQARPTMEARIPDQIDIPHRVDALLAMWALWMKAGSVGTGYPKKSAGIASGGINCWDDLSDEIDAHTVTTVNTILHDLDHRHYAAISNFYCGKMWNYRGDETETLKAALVAFEKRAVNRGLM